VVDAAGLGFLRFPGAWNDDDARGLAGPAGGAYRAQFEMAVATQTVVKAAVAAQTANWERARSSKTTGPQ